MKKLSLLIILVLTVLAFSAGTFASDAPIAPIAPVAFNASDSGESLTAQVKQYSPYTEKTYNCNRPVAAMGIDVCHFNGDIDWKAVAEDGIGFVLIRVGHHNGYTDEIEEDRCYKQYIEGARAAGLKVGVYIFSQYLNEEEALAEAEWLTEKIKDYHIDMPVVTDVEFEHNIDSYGFQSRMRKADADGTLTKEGMTEAALAFCGYVRDKGYSPMVYANCDMYKRYLDIDSISPEADIWVARYNTEIESKYNIADYDFWQYSASGHVKGIDSEVDCNFWFTDEVKEFPFTDVKEGDWFYEAAVYAYEKGLISGTSATTFAPETNLSRSMMVTILYRLQGSPAVSGKSKFKDLTQDWYKAAVLWAEQNGIVNGTSETTFDPGADITREQAAAILYRYTDFCGKDVTPCALLNVFSDGGTVSPYAIRAMGWAVAEGYFSGYGDGVLGPRNTMTRAQLASVLMRYTLK